MKERDELFGYYPSVIKGQENSEVYVKGRTRMCNSPTSKQENLK